MRASVRREVRIARGAAQVWAVVGRPELLHHWFPGMTDCSVDGTVRRVTLATGIVLEEHIVTNDAIQRRFQYKLAPGLFKDHLGTIDVLAISEADTLVTYASDCDPAALALVLGGATGGALEELKRQLDAGAGPALEAAAATDPIDPYAARVPQEA